MIIDTPTLSVSFWDVMVVFGIIIVLSFQVFVGFFDPRRKDEELAEAARLSQLERDIAKLRENVVLLNRELWLKVGDSK